VAKSNPLRDALRHAIESSQPFSEAALAPLIEYDRVHGGDLVRTLGIYLSSGGNASRSAEQLYLHRSGLLYRLRRIEELLGTRLDIFEDRVALELAILATMKQTDP
jgi:DNA-binding PucR family transcriptional regulator